jgi:hypothetical protein
MKIPKNLLGFPGRVKKIHIEGLVLKFEGGEDECICLTCINYGEPL